MRRSIGKRLGIPTPARRKPTKPWRFTKSSDPKREIRNYWSAQ